MGRVLPRKGGMKNVKRLFVLFLLLLPGLLPARVKPDPQLESLVLAHVTVIDVTGGPSKADMTIVINGDHITDLGEAASVSIPQNAKVINAAGKFLIPGLWDMHVHWDIRDSLTLFTANGVTGI